MSSFDQHYQTKCRLHRMCECDLEAAGLADPGAGVAAPICGGHVAVVGRQVGPDTHTLAGTELGEEGVQLQQVDPVKSVSNVVDIIT